MLSEIPDVKQEDGIEEKRRWFTDEELDLIVWIKIDGKFTSFQLCYDRKKQERSITFNGRGYEFDVIECGETNIKANRSPMLIEDDHPDVAYAIREFQIRGLKLESDLYTFILNKLQSAGMGLK